MRRGKDWAERDYSKRIADSGRSRLERLQAILASRADPAKANQTLVRPGVGVPTAIRSATTAGPNAWASLTAGAAAVDTVLDAVKDGRDRVLLGWPERPGNGAPRTHSRSTDPPALS